MSLVNRFLYLLMIISLVGPPCAFSAEENVADETPLLQQQINELNGQITLQKKESDGLKERIKNQQSQIQTLQKNVSRVYQQTIEDTGQIEVQQQTAAELQQTIIDQQEQIDTLKSNLAFVYKQTIRDTGLIEKYKLGNEVYLRASYYDVNREDMLTGSGAGADDYDNAFVNNFDLKFSAEPTDEIRFNATLTMYKLWGTWNSPESIRSSDFSYSGTPSDSAVKIKRAYVDFRPEWLGRHVNLTFGRLPTSDGYLTRYRYNRPAQTSYPDLAFNAESDGAAFSFYFDFPLATSVNLVYARSEDDTDMYPFLKDPEGLEDIDFYAVQLNSELSFLDHSAFTFQWLRVDNIRSTGDDIIRDYIDDYNTLLKFSGQSPFVTDIAFPEALGYVDKYTFQLTKDHFFSGPIDFFASVSWSKSRPNGERIQLNGQPLNPAMLPADLQPLTRYLYLVSADNQDSHSGWAVYAGLRYNIESEFFKNPKIGLEYNQGSEYWVGLNIAATDPLQKLNTRGSVWEIYWVQPLVENMLQCRTGYQQVKRDYTESLLSGLYGGPADTEEDDQLFYASFEFMF